MSRTAYALKRLVCCSFLIGLETVRLETRVSTGFTLLEVYIAALSSLVYTYTY